jgi:hypothetical protein
MKLYQIISPSGMTDLVMMLQLQDTPP